MWLIVDGYNVLRSSGRTAPLKGNNLQAERERFIEGLGCYRGQRRDKITVVFDGFRAGMDSPTVKKRGGVEVIYSRRGQTADEIIKQMVEQTPNPRDIMVVSSDREISSFVKSLGASVTGARSLADKLGLHGEKRIQSLDEGKMDRATYYERYIKGYLEEEEPSTKPRKGKSRRSRRRSSLKLWRSA